jgi:hypothetical protein
MKLSVTIEAQTRDGLSDALYAVAGHINDDRAYSGQGSHEVGGVVTQSYSWLLTDKGHHVSSAHSTKPEFDPQFETQVPPFEDIGFVSDTDLRHDDLATLLQEYVLVPREQAEDEPDPDERPE